MNPYLHGVARNHYKGYTTTNWAEQEYTAKMGAYNSISNNFSNGGQKLYRIGHNVSDGNLAFQPGNSNRQHGGWHWATKYGDGFNEEYVAIATGLGANAVFPTANGPTTTNRLGAGTRHYCYMHEHRLFSGFAVTINYLNSISFRFDMLPHSFSENGGSFAIPNANNQTQFASLYEEQVAAAIIGSYTDIAQVGGPIAGDVIGPGNYELNFRVTNGDDVAYWGMIISVNAGTSTDGIVRTQGDELLTIDPNPSAYPLQTSALVRHSMIHTTNNFRYSGNGFPMNTDMNTVFGLNDAFNVNNTSNTVNNLPLANLNFLYGYDDIEMMLEDTKALNIGGLSIVANISTGYPEEIVGLIEYLNELGEKVEIVELGSELMGNWNKGQAQGIYDTPTQMANTTLPYAKAIKDSPNKEVSSVKIATTSTYNFLLDFWYGGNFLQFKQTIQDWIAPYGDKYLDYINIHDYPDFSTNTGQFVDNNGNPTYQQVQKRWNGDPNEYCFKSDGCTPANTMGEHCWFQHDDPNDCSGYPPGQGMIIVNVTRPHTERTMQTAGAHHYFQETVLPAIRAGLGTKKDKIGIIITEAGLHANFLGFDADGYPITFEPPVNTFSEALWFAESFMVAANEDFDAHIPFALLKELSGGFTQGGMCDDPSNEGTRFGDDVPFNMNFYQNTSETSYDEIFYKPVFKTKRMLFENLGTKVIKEKDDDMDPTNDPVFLADVPMFNPPPAIHGQVVETPMLNTLVTLDESEENLLILITNCNGEPIGQNAFIPLQLEVDGKSISAFDVMIFNADEPLDRQPSYSDANGAFITHDCNDRIAFNHDQPSYYVHNGSVINIPNLSICILKVALDNFAPPTCSAPTATGTSCDAINLTWDIPTFNPSPTAPTAVVSQEVYYYEQLDGTGTAPTAFDPNDLNWKLFADVGTVCTTTNIVGLPFPQDEYQIAVVITYQTAGTVGPGLTESVCFTTGSTTYCENHIDRPSIDTDFFHSANGTTTANPRAACLSDIFDYSDVAFCREQLGTIAPVTCPNMNGSLRFDLIDDVRVDAMSVLGGSVEGDINILYDDYSSGIPNYDNLNNPITVTLSEGVWTRVLFPCGGIAADRIRIDKQDGEAVRRIILHGEPIGTPPQGYGMPKCCASSDAIVLDASTPNVSTAIQKGYMHAITQGKEFYITNPNFVINEPLGFTACKFFLEENVRITVNDGMGITLGECTLRGCEKMWDGIYANNSNVFFYNNTEISDANFALKLARTQQSSTQPIIHISDTKFFRNYNSIWIDGGSYNSTIPATNSGYRAWLNNVTIDGTPYNLKPYLNLGKRRANRGLFLLYNDKQFLTYNLHLRNALLPIEVSNCSNGTLFNNVDIETPPDWGPVAVNSRRNNDIDIIGKISNFHIGVLDVESADVALLQSYLPGVEYGYIGVRSDYSAIISNTINNGSSGILLAETSSYNVVFNTISNDLTKLPNQAVFSSSFLPNAYSKIGVAIGNFTTPPPTTLARSVFHNWITTSVEDPAFVSAGVILDNSTGTNVQKNEVGLQNFSTAPTIPAPTTPFFYGIYKHNGLDNLICGNDVEGLYNFDRGIGSFLSPGRVQCNYINQTEDALYYVGDNEANNTISGNEIRNSAIGIRVNDDVAMQAILGTQTLQTNRWFDTWTHGGEWTINVSGAPLIGLDQSRFRNNETYPFTPLTDPVPDDWFVKLTDQNVYNACLNSSGVAVFSCNPTGGPECSECMRTFAQNPSWLTEPYRSMILRRQYAEIKDNYPNGGHTAQMDTFLNTYQGRGFVLLADLDRTIADPLKDRPDLKAGLQTWRDSLELINVELKAHYDSLMNLSAEDLNAYLTAGNEATVVQQANYFHEQLAVVKNEANTIIDHAIQDVLVENQSLVLDDQFTELERDVNTIYLNWRISGNTFLDSTDLEYVDSIASLCPQDWGDAVLKARSLWFQNGGGIKTAWEQCFPVGSTAGNQGKQIFEEGQGLAEEYGLPDDKAMAFPVPVESHFTISIPEPYIGGKYMVTSSVGITVGQGVLAETQTQVDGSGYSNGVHFIRITKENLRPITISIVVQKL